MFYTYDMARAYQEQLLGDAEMEPAFEQAQPRTTRALWVLVSDRLRAIETPQWLRNSAGDARTTV